MSRGARRRTFRIVGRDVGTGRFLPIELAWRRPVTAILQPISLPRRRGR